jgi:hypothetical protein
VLSCLHGNIEVTAEEMVYVDWGVFRNAVTYIDSYVPQVIMKFV